MQYKEKKNSNNIKQKKEAELIEEAAEQAAKRVKIDIGEYIVKAVTDGIAYEYMDVPCGRNQFYEARQQFFYVLSEIR